MRRARTSDQVSRRPASDVNQLETDRGDAVQHGQRRNFPKDRILVVRALQIVVRDLGAQMVDVVENDVAGEELERLRQLQVDFPRSAASV